jgi:hypothetical protein
VEVSYPEYGFISRGANQK